MDRERRRFFPVKSLERLEERVNQLSEKRDEGHRPLDLDDFVVSVETVTINSRNFIRLLIWFEALPEDPNFAGAVIWQKGYATGNVLGDPDDTIGKEETLPFQILTRTTGSPVTLILEATGEDIVIGAEAINEAGLGSGVDTMPTQAITLI